ncbi:hypothetical protein [Streptacidiphilus sp. MAP5-3]
MSTHGIPALLCAQAAYAVVAAGYHALSIREKRAGRRPLHSESGGARFLVMVAYTASLGLGLARLDVAYRIAMAVFIVILGYGGLLVHLLRGPGDYYRSRAAWASPIAINVAGLALNITGLVAGA